MTDNLWDALDEIGKPEEVTELRAKELAESARKSERMHKAKLIPEPGARATNGTLPERMKAEAITLREMGAGLKLIAADMGVSQVTAWRWTRHIKSRCHRSTGQGVAATMAR